MATTWRLKSFLETRNIRPSRLAAETSGQLSRTSVYGLVGKQPPKSVYLATIDVLLPALTKLTGEEVSVADLIVYDPEPSPKPVEEMDAETRAWLEADLAPPLEPYDWGDVDPMTLPGGRLEYTPGEGFVITEDEPA